jgi:hypothetical protein
MLIGRLDEANDPREGPNRNDAVALPPAHFNAETQRSQRVAKGTVAQFTKQWVRFSG